LKIICFKGLRPRDNTTLSDKASELLLAKTNKNLREIPPSLLLINLESKIEYRYLLCHNYLSFYRYLDRTIYIDRILNSRRDYLRILLDEVH